MKVKSSHNSHSTRRRTTHFPSLFGSMCFGERFHSRASRHPFLGDMLMLRSLLLEEGKGIWSSEWHFGRAEDQQQPLNIANVNTFQSSGYLHFYSAAFPQCRSWDSKCVCLPLLSFTRKHRGSLSEMFALFACAFLEESAENLGAMKNVPADEIKKRRKISI